jgi:GT2 family glycosyltransferase
MIQVAVVILNYNGEHLLRQFLPSVIKNSEPASIVVIDNGSTDSSTTLLQKEFPEVRVIALQQNYGFCGGYNRGLRQVDAKYVVLLNSDIEVTANWLTPMKSILDGDESIAAIQPKILAWHQKNKFEYAGAGGGFIDSMGYPFCRGRIFDYTETDNGQYNDTREIFWATGACLMIRLNIFHEFDGLDEDLFAHMEEIDLCWKINRGGRKIYYCGQSHVFHVGAGTLGYDSPRKTYLNFRNGLILLLKHLDTSELCYKLPVRIFLDWAAAFQFILKAKWRNALSVIQAHIRFFAGISKHLTKRKAIRKAHPAYNRKNIFKGLIIIEYFLKGIRVITPQ